MSVSLIGGFAMPYAVNLLLDDDTAAPVRRLVRALSDALPGPDGFKAETHPPHLTLVVMPDRAEPDDIQTAAFDSLVLLAALPITMSGIGLFPQADALWLAPAATAPLLSLQQSLISALGNVPVDPRYRQGHWVPHVTIGRGGRGRLGETAAALAALWKEPITGFANRLELATFQPVKVLRSRELPPFG